MNHEEEFDKSEGMKSDLTAAYERNAGPDWTEEFNKLERMKSALTVVFERKVSTSDSVMEAATCAQAVAEIVRTQAYLNGFIEDQKARGPNKPYDQWTREERVATTIARLAGAGGSSGRRMRREP